MQLIDPNLDRWRGADAADAEPWADRPRLFDAAQWLAQPEHAGPSGLQLGNDQAVDDLPLQGLELIVLNFPRWSDGRAYTQARLLRRRRAYRAELRASGDVVVDMLPLLVRCGFDSAVLSPGESLDVARRILTQLADARALAYQGDALEPRPHFSRI